ncbi:MAG: succinate dehydrogenase, cytochrome b556 subunit [Burkholderiaceae bacterium]|jgi:succinate dehydrogenase / fumarate reductase cytochrome b subunit|nr:succinate dehydrogenase, cytochrome b556 subunit [Burkholderiales bacterium]MCZ8104241.1 succinate dehydrogenase, cytochrome b556 subunit [Burkholderiales bacterium]MCZ8340792.1 succinate dehydrogenase, cytochrome b556 subunit [Burkholderiaceae bacterium]
MADIAAKKARPQYRNIHVSQILSYRLPPAGIVSILHRISGALLFLLGIPFILYLLQQSLTSEISFETYRAVVGSVPGKLVLLVLGWAFIHHAVAGIRYLLLDRHVGIQKEAARSSATVVLGITAALTVVFALKLFGAF